MAGGISVTISVFDRLLDWFPRERFSENVPPNPARRR
jgi:hypothetical protein